MNICVGSYYTYCIKLSTVIVYIKKNNNLVACLEFQIRNYPYGEMPVLVQAKGPHNDKLPINIQKLISRFCLDYNSKINSIDISPDIVQKHNLKLSEKNGYISIEDEDENKNIGPILIA